MSGQSLDEYSYIAGLARLSTCQRSKLAVQTAQFGRNNKMASADQPQYTLASATYGEFHSGAAVAGSQAQPTVAGISSRALNEKMDRSQMRKSLSDAGLVRLASQVDQVVFSRGVGSESASAADVRASAAFRYASGKTSKAMGDDRSQDSNVRRNSLQVVHAVEAKSLIFGHGEGAQTGQADLRAEARARIFEGAYGRPSTPGRASPGRSASAPRERPMRQNFNASSAHLQRLMSGEVGVARDKQSP